MSGTSSDEDIALDSSVSNYYYLCRHKKKIGVHFINRKRLEYGEFHHLYDDLRRDSERFFGYMRMKIGTFDYIMALIEPQLQKQWKNCHAQPISAEERLMVTLRYLSTGISFRSLAYSFRMGKSTVAKVVTEVVQVLWDTLKGTHMKVPSTEDYIKIAEDYNQLWNFPHCIGSLDGKHIKGLVDAHYRFINIEVGGYGKQSDGGTFKASALYKKLIRGTLGLPEDGLLQGIEIAMPYVILADEAYPLMRNLLKPYSRRRNLDGNQENFNKRLSRARRTVECAFGIINAKWEILQRPINAKLELIDSIVKAICVLHNTIIDMEGMDHNLADNCLENQNHCARGGRHTEEAKNIRDFFKDYLSANPICEVEKSAY